jgi:hypothetical protein
MVDQAVPELGKRYRCAGCGNVTRFDIESVERVRRFWHADLSGEGKVESEERLDVTVEAVTCHWCGTGTRIEVVESPIGEPAGDITS